MDTSTMTDDELIAMYERIQREVANRQTRKAIADQLIDHVDRVVASAPEAMSGEFVVGRVQVRADHVSVAREDTHD